MNELVSTHGYSQNQIMVWKYPSLAKVLALTILHIVDKLQSENYFCLNLRTNFEQVATLTGHSMRVLYLAMSPDGQVLNVLTLHSSIMCS